MEKIALGIDVGGSHITCQLFDLEENNPLSNSKQRFSMDSNGPSDSILNGWVEAIHLTAETLEISELEGIGFAMPGPFDYVNGIAKFEGVPKFRELYGINIKSELIRRMKLSDEFKIRFLNDATCFAVGESWLGKVSNYDRVIALTLGTGFGTTFIKNGLPVAGNEGIPNDGFLYHIPFKNAIADDYFSTRWFINNYNEKSDTTISGVKELAKMAMNEKIAREIFQEFGANLGTFLAPWVKQFKANAIVIGGNISRSYKLFQKTLEDHLGKTIIMVSEMEENAALAGGARLCDNAFYEELLKTNIVK